MLKEKLKKSFIEKQLEKELSKDQVRIVMPDDVLEKIQYLCREISEVEWSGILLYDFTGTIKNPENMIITLKDIIPMHKGVSTYTEYSFNEKSRDQSGYTDRHIDYCEENEDALGWNIAHIHSHNSMSVFFSGTDMKELEDNCGAHNFYLSLIVNNDMDFTAKIAIEAKAEGTVVTNYTALDENGNEYNIIKNIKLKAVKNKVVVYDCSITSNKDKVKIRDKNFFERCIDSIKEIAKSKPKSTVSTMYEGSNIPCNVFNNNSREKNNRDLWTAWDTQKDDFEDEIINDQITDFCKELFNINDRPLPENKSLDNVIRSSILFKNLPGLIMDRYPKIFANHFGDNISEDKFLEIVEGSLDIMSTYMIKYPTIEGVMDALENLVDKFMNCKN